MQCPEILVEKLATRGVHLDPANAVSKREAQGSILDCFELTFFEGDWTGGLVINGVHYRAAAGHFICCKPTQHRRAKAPLRSYSISINTADPQLQQALNSLPTYAFHPEMDTIIDLVKKMYFLATRTSLLDRLEISSQTATVLRMLLQAQYPLEFTRARNPRRHQAALLSANEYLKTHLEEDVDLVQLAKGSHLHPTYFHKLFTAAFGKTPAEQLMYYRILASREYLRRDDCTIAEIARKCGFSSQSYYCRKYKEISLETPSQFRNAIRMRRGTALSNNKK